MKLLSYFVFGSFHCEKCGLKKLNVSKPISSTFSKQIIIFPFVFVRSLSFWVFRPKKKKTLISKKRKQYPFKLESQETETK